MPTTTSETNDQFSAADPANSSVGTAIEAQFETHDVTAFVFETRYSENKQTRDSAKWGVICEDCGRAQDFHIVIDEDNEYRISPVFVESLEDMPCEPYVLPDDAPTGEHSLLISNEDPSVVSGSRRTYCTECGRTTNLPRNPKYADSYLERFGALPCQDSYSDAELAGSVLYQPIDSTPDRDEVGIDNWQRNDGKGWGSQIGGFWKHPEVPLLVVLKKDRSCRWIEIQGNAGGQRASPSIRNPVIAKFAYQDRTVENPEETNDHEAVVEVLTFMQAANEMAGDEFDKIAAAVENPFRAIVERNSVDRATPAASE